MISELLLLPLTVRGIVDCWRNGDIFAELRTVVSLHVDEEVEHTWRQLPYNLATLYGRLWQILHCPYCLTWQLALWLALLILTRPWQPTTMQVAVQVAVFGFAAAAASWLLDGLLPQRLRYSREHTLPQGDESPDES